MCVKNTKAAFKFATFQSFPNVSQILTKIKS
uniref:Uncharacterized protein n=1 Tax=Tetranychus urticae TaxID=32264 RepID=T1JS85_TETUR